MKKAKFLCAVLSLVIFICTFTATTVSAEGIAYSATNVAGKKGDTITVYVKISSDREIWGANVMLGYNSSELEYVSSNTGDAASSGSLYNTGSSVNYSGLINAEGGTVFVVEFRILKSSGASTLKLTSTENTDYSGNVHSCTVSNGKVTVLNDSAVVGDANEDNKLSAVDARLVLQSVAGINKLDNYQSLLADMNGDGVVTAVDARIILQMVAGLK